MSLTTISQELSALKVRAAKLNAEVHSATSKEIKKRLTAEYMVVAAQIADAKRQKADATTASSSRSDAVKIATLLFPKEQKVQYFATTENYIELLVTLHDVFGNDLPAVTSFFSASPDQVVCIPDAWYELVAKDETVTTT